MKTGSRFQMHILEFGGHRQMRYTSNLVYLVASGWKLAWQHTPRMIGSELELMEGLQGLQNIFKIVGKSVEFE